MEIAPQQYTEALPFSDGPLQKGKSTVWETMSRRTLIRSGVWGGGEEEGCSSHQAEAPPPDTPGGKFAWHPKTFVNPNIIFSGGGSAHSCADWSTNRPPARSAASEVKALLC